MNRSLIFNDFKSYEPINKEDDISMWNYMFMQNEVKRMEERLTLVSPWINFKKEIEVLFARDMEVDVEFMDCDEDECPFWGIKTAVDEGIIHDGCRRAK